MKGKPSNTDKFDQKRFGHMASYPLLAIRDLMAVNRLYRRMPAMQRLYKHGGWAGHGLLRYIVLVYDKKSPFKVEYHQLQERKQAVAAFCGFKKGDDWHMALTELSDEKVVDALCDFLKFQNDNVWSMIVQFEEVFLNNQRQIFLGVSGLGKDTDRMTASLNSVKLANANKSLAAEIKALYVEFTGNDPDAEVAIMQQRPLAPEIVADWEVMDDYDPDFLNNDDEDGVGDEEE